MREVWCTPHAHESRAPSKTVEIGEAAQQNNETTEGPTGPNKHRTEGTTRRTDRSHTMGKRKSRKLVGCFWIT
jgi:hypothetical protein